MSDFAGVWRLDGAPVERGVLEHLGAALDGKSIGPSRIVQAGSVGLVHRQHGFSPEDAAERMPLALPSGAHVLADSRLNARPDLARALELPSQTPDGALIGAAFERWTSDAFARLHGDYAVAIWSPAEQRLYLARDPAGYRTLYWFRDDRLIAFSTRMRALLAMAEVSRDLDDRALADFLILNHGPPEQTLYRAIRRVPMGCLAILDPRGTTVRSHWSPPEPGTLRRRTDLDYEEEGRDVIDRAIADVLRASGDPTLLLTGGLDSTAIAESAVRQLAPGRLLAVTRRPRGVPDGITGQYFDETRRVRPFADQLPGLDWHSVGDDEGGTDDFDARRFFLEAGAPSRAPQNVAWFFPVYRFMATRGSRVTIGGEQGNTYFSDDGGGFLPELFLSLRWPTFAQGVRANARAKGIPAWRGVLNALRAFEPLDRRLRRTGERSEPWGRHSALGPALAAELGLGESLDLDRYRMRVGGGHRSARAARDWIWQDEVARDFRGPFRAMTGIEHRLPLADRRVVEFFGALPPEQFFNHGMNRSIARRILRGRAPDETVLGASRGVQNGDWFERVSGQRADMLRDVERMKARPDVGRVIDLDRLEALLRDWPVSVAAAERRRREYLQLLTRGMEAARFIEWHGGGN